jgi:hypothetical protein
MAQLTLRFRTMSESDYQTLLKSGKLSATGETFISTEQVYSSKFDGVLVRLELKQGTRQALEAIGTKAPGKDIARDFPSMRAI